MIETELNFTQPFLQPWYEPVFTEKALQVAILRLDKMHPVLGGNKWMKLRSFLQQAKTENKAGILTKGGPWSNHIHACAWACHQLKLPLQIWIKGHEKMQTPMLADAQVWEASIRFINRSTFYNEVETVEFAAANNLLYIPMGGADDRGITAGSQFLQELHLSTYNYAACAVGTATTLGGLAFVPHNFPTVIGVEAGTNDESVLKKIATWQQELPTKELILNTDYSFGGFAKRTTELVNFANHLYQQHHIPTDLVYTTKLFFAVRQLARQDYFLKNSSIMVLHSGGLQGNRSLPAGSVQF